MRTVLLLLLALTIQVASAQDGNSYPGFVLKGEDAATLSKLQATFKKCISDSWTFRQLVKNAGGKANKISKSLSFTAYRVRSSVIGDAGTDLGTMHIDFSDLDVLPNPIAVDHGLYNGKFEPLVATPAWATTVCGWIGHEIAELIEDLQDGHRDRPVHHYNIANVKEDQVVKDYYGAERQRGEDCRLRHLDHDDILIEIGGHGIEVLHLNRDLVYYHTNQEVDKYWDADRLAYIEYLESTPFPGRQAGSSLCRVSEK